MDGLDIEIEGDSDPAVALALLRMIMQAEGKDEGGASADWILATYARCLATVMGAEVPDIDEGEDEVAESDEDEGEEEDEDRRDG